MMPTYLNLHSIAYPVTALGPGQRLALWVSGCSLDCKGCITPQLQAKAGGKQIRLDTLIKHLLGLSAQLDGITLTGGEPFEQAQALSALLIALKQARPDWNILAFSGYPLAHLRRDDAEPEKTGDLLAQVDILVDGPYLPNQAGEHPLTASSNQHVHYLSQRGETLRPCCEALPLNHANLAMGTAETHNLVGIIRAPERALIHQKLGLKTPT